MGIKMKNPKTKKIKLSSGKTRKELEKCDGIIGNKEGKFIYLLSDVEGDTVGKVIKTKNNGNIEITLNQSKHNKDSGRARKIKLSQSESEILYILIKKYYEEIENV